MIELTDRLTDLQDGDFCGWTQARKYGEWVTSGPPDLPDEDCSVLAQPRTVTRKLKGRSQGKELWRASDASLP